MSKYDYIGNNMIFIKEGIMLGVISTCVLSHFRIYTQYINYLSLGFTSAKAIFILSEVNKVSEQTIYRIKWEMEDSI
jgi:hypothetical protein